MRVAVLAVGDELLRGEVDDGNGAWLGRRLTAAGLTVTRRAVAGDDVTAIAQALTDVLRVADAVVVTGGLGPTSDDVTREALASVARVALVRDAAVAADLARWYADRGQEVPPLALRQADVPRGAGVLANPVGTAPGLVLPVGEGLVFALPGVPAEAAALTEGSVLPELVRRAGATTPLVTRTLRVALLGEPAVAGRLAPLEGALERLPGQPVRLAYLPHPGEVLVRFGVRAAEPAVGRSVLTPYVERAREILGDAVAGEDDQGLDVTCHRLLAARAATVAVAESLTGGLLGAALTGPPGSSATFRGGMVAYATGLKQDLLDVDPDLLSREGAVHPEVALAMARGVRTRLGATYGVATTGVAGPESQDGHPVGTVHVAVVGPRGESVVSPRLRGDRETIRVVTVVHGLDLLRRALLGLPPEVGRE